jgi:hypothetical protein
MFGACNSIKMGMSLNISFMNYLRVTCYHALLSNEKYQTKAPVIDYKITEV